MGNELKELMRILNKKLITPVFQPIVSLRNGELLGYEALSRGPHDSSLAKPDKLFDLAEKNKCLWKLDYLCRSMAIMKAKDYLKDKMLFINVDPKVLYDKKFHQGSTLKILNKCNISSQNIVFEISEKSAIDDYEGFQALLENYRGQGYKLALDDVGSGYSGLTLLAKTSPQFIKIDIALIKEIDKDKVKRAIVKALVDFSHTTNIKIIAEGIETQEELSTLINLGIEYGQGFYIGRPLPVMSLIAIEIKEKIKLYFFKKEEHKMNTKLSTSIGEIATKQTTFSSDTLGSKVLDHLHTLQEHIDIIIVDNKEPVGLLSQDVFYSSLATTYGISVYSKRPVKLLMDTEPLILEYSTSIEEASRRALARDSKHIYDSLIITKNKEYCGTVTIKKLLEVTTKLEINRARHANPLTGLPGNMMIEWEVNRHIKDLIPFTAIYIDLDNFKVYNDIYGFEAGDKALVATANILNESLKCHTNEYFLGHIGGDDFIAFIRENHVEMICRAIIQAFTEESQKFYSIEHQQQQYVIAKNRRGTIEKIPLMSISLAVLVVNSNKNIDAKKLAAKAAEIKKLCKAEWTNNFIVQVYDEM